MKKSYFARIVIILIIIILLSTNFLLSNDNSFKWKIGEELIYKVK